MAFYTVQWALITASAVASWGLFDHHRKAILEIADHANREEWPQVLTSATGIGPVNAASRIQIHRALYHCGMLLESLFCTQQSSDFGILPGPAQGMKIFVPLSASLMELGQVNLAEHWAHEALEIFGEQPDLLRLLCQINVVKGRPQAARVFLGLLRKNPLHKSWADSQLKLLKENSSLAVMPDLERLRAVKVTTDYPSSHIPTHVLLLQLLHTNATNRMAFEYLMAYYLLAAQPEGILKNISRFDDFQMAVFPRHIEEALLAHRQKLKTENKQMPVLDLHGRSIRTETSQRFERFIHVVSQYKGDFRAAHDVLQRDFGDTYWYYDIYGRSEPSPGGFPKEKTL